MLKGFLNAVLRVLVGTALFLALAATVGIPAGKRGPALAQPNAEPLLGLDLYRPVPDDNPLTAEKVALGRRLFHERLLSRDLSLSCAGCHDPARAGARSTGGPADHQRIRDGHEPGRQQNVEASCGRLWTPERGRLRRPVAEPPSRGQHPG